MLKKNIEDGITEMQITIHPELYKIKLEEIERLKEDKMNVLKGRVSIRTAAGIFLKSLTNAFIK